MKLSDAMMYTMLGTAAVRYIINYIIEYNIYIYIYIYIIIIYNCHTHTHTHGCNWTPELTGNRSGIRLRNSPRCIC